MTKDSKQREKERLSPKAMDEMREWLTTMPLSVQNPDKSLQYISDFLAVAAHLRLPQNSRILELGAGSCWPSEWLYRMGYRTVSSDISIDMLRLGRERFEPLRRERDNYRIFADFVCGDAEFLPFGDGMFDAVIIFNALHHFPDPATALKEIGRILNGSGRLVFAEPGEGHSQSDEARREMDEHGVLEKDIVIEEIARLGSAAGFRKTEVILNRFPDAALTWEEWSRFSRPWRGVRAKAHFMSDLVDRQRKHPCLVLSKGSEGALDSRRPGVLRAGLKVLNDPASVQAGHPFRIVVEAVNRGDTRWVSRGSFLAAGSMNRGEGGYVNLGAKLLRSGGELLDDNFGRGSFTDDVPPGEKVDIAAILRAPHEPGAYRIKLDLVDEGVAWFEDCGSETTAFELEVLESVDPPLFDSRFPDRLEAAVKVERLTPSGKDGGAIEVRITVRNEGNTTWFMHSPGDDPPAFGGGYVRLGVQLKDSEGKLLDMDYHRVGLPSDVAPGDEAILGTFIPLPRDSGRFNLVFDMVDEQITWFGGGESGTCMMEIRVPREV